MKRAIHFCLITVAVLFLTPTARAQIRAAGYIDTNFLATCFGLTSPRALAIQFDGKIIAGGNFSTAPTVACVNAIDRLNVNGSADATFRSPFLAGHVVNALAFQGNKIIVAGAVGNGVSTFPLTRLNSNGTIDDSFQRSIQNIAVVFNALLIQPDGKIVAAGDLSSGPGVTFGYIVRVTANGARDLNFADGHVTDALGSFPGIAALAYAGGGNILVGGSFTTYRNVTRPGLARIDSTGALDPTYTSAISDGIVRALLVQPDGKVLVAGDFTSGLPNRVLVRLNSSGTLDSTFQPLSGLGTIGLSLALQPDGKILLGHGLGVMRLETNGVPDATFGPPNAFPQLGTAAENATALALTANSNLIVGATRVLADGIERRGVTRLFAFVPPLPLRPVIVQQPLTQIVDSGANVTFSVMATGAPPLSYQWRKEATRIKNATTATFSLTNVNSTHIGNYSVIVANAGGAVTSALARLIVNFNTSPLILMTNGAGAVLPKTAGKELEIGRSYTLIAKPAVGNLFSNWTGGVTSSSPVLTFVMQSNLALIANFVPSPFIPVKGVYNGLFFDMSSPAHENAGFVSLKLDDKGGYKGSVRMGARLRRFAGTFSLDLTSHLAVASVAATPALNLSLQLDVNNATITGFGSNSFGNISLLAYRNPFSSAANPAPDAGLYNAIVPGIPDTSIEGDGFAGLTVSTSGRVSGRGTLADGTAFQILSATAGNAAVPVYVSLYGGQGSLFGWLTVTNSGANDVAGTVWWFKPASAGGLNNPGGISVAAQVIGSRYVAPAPRTPVLTLNNGVVILSGGNLAEPIANSITLGGDNKIAGDNQLMLTISPAKGSITGSFVNPSDGKKRTVKGVALPTQQQGRGFFLGTSKSGRLFIGEQP